MAITIRLLNLLRRWFRLDKPRPFSDMKEGGAEPDPIDNRDYLAPIQYSYEPLPKIVDLRNHVREIKSQGRWNSCVAHAICSAVELMMYKYKKQTHIPLSERFNYYYGRIASGFDVNQNIGMYPRQAIKMAFEHGLSPEILCHYNDSKSKEPSQISKIFGNLIMQRLKEYKRVIGTDQIKSTLSNGIPVMVSVEIYDYWNNTKDGKIRLPKQTDKGNGRHYILLVGYTDTAFIFLNSWNSTWGDFGFGYLPLSYPTMDEWVIELK